LPQDLKAEAYNGKFGVVVGPSVDSTRLNVKIEGTGEIFSISLQNVSPATTGFMTGMQVMLKVLHWTE
jgi:hypothetical protein